MRKPATGLAGVRLSKERATAVSRTVVYSFMAFDIYVGPLSRYIAGDWKSIAQQIAEQEGLTFVKIGPKKSLLSRLFEPKREEVYRVLREGIRNRLILAGFSDPIWDDSPDREYVTDRPGWEGLVAFVAQYAYARNPELTPPAKALSMPELSEDPAFMVEVEKEGSPVVAIMSTRFFLPGTFSYVFSLGDYGVAPLDLLDRALAAICDHSSLDRNMLIQTDLDQVDENATFAEAALYGTTIYARLVQQALSLNLPLIHDF